MTAKTIEIGIIGLDTSHVTAFSELLNDANSPYHIPGGRVVCAYPGGSPDFDLSISRVKNFTDQLRDEFGVLMVDSPEAVAERCDAILLESVDGRVHPEQFRKVAPFKKPVFIDKPFALSAAEAAEMIRLAEKYEVPIMSSSALRYAEGLQQALLDTQKGAVIGADAYGPMAMLETQPGFFWYGIHSVEMMFAILGPGCTRVAVQSTEDHDCITGFWDDGRIGRIRGNRKGNNTFGALIHREKGTDFVDVYANPKPYYASLLEQVMDMFKTGKPRLDINETLQVIRFIAAANQSRRTGAIVGL